MSQPRRSLRNKKPKIYREDSSSGSEDETIQVKPSVAVPEAGAEHHPPAGSKEGPMIRDDEIIRLPTLSEVASICATIQQKEADLAVIDQEYKLLMEKAQQVKMKRQRLAEELLSHRSVISRMRAVPQEVLSHIFLLYIEDPDQSPWTLVHVCRAWRAAGLRTGQLWSKIMITTTAWQEQGHSRRKHGYEICGTADQLTRALKRAGPALLHIHLLSLQPKKMSFHKTLKYAGERLCQDLYNTFLDSQAFSRVRVLTISGNSRILIQAWLQPLTYVQLPRLEELVVEAGSFHLDMFSKAFSSPIRPRTVQIDGGQYFASMLKHLHHPTIDRLSFSTRFWGSRDVIQELYPCLRGAHNLTSLRLTHSNGGSTFQVTYQDFNITLPSLKDLTLQGVILRGAFKSPSLEVLLILENGKIITPEITTYPNLKHIKIVCVEPEFLLRFKAPAVETLDLQVSASISSNRSFLKELGVCVLSTGSIEPTRFYLRKTYIDNQTLLELLRCMPRLSEVELQCIAISQQFLNNLTPTIPSRRKDADLPIMDQDPGHLPLLKKLRIDFEGSKGRKDKAAICTLAKRVMKARVRANCPLDEALFRVSEEEGWINLLP
ncbi:hypothetical protein CPB86DRAFT_812296 [Serendipita vermifera]|nr:hypothetical protein CPB86DRAFT_812296 [Serendipita vermifera]